jgi:hypothetical protein
MALEVTFVRHRERRDRIYVTRPDGTSLSWDFPSYGDRLPHDLVHLVVEDGLGIDHGFWGLVAGGVEVRLIDNQATLVREGKPLVGQPGAEFTDLRRAEEAVTLFGPTGPGTDEVTLPAGVSPAAVASTRRRLRQLGLRWRGLGDGGAITLTFPGTLTFPPTAGEPVVNRPVVNRPVVNRPVVSGTERKGT